MFLKAGTGPDRGEHGQDQIGFQAAHVLRSAVESLRKDVVSIGGAIHLHGEPEMGIEIRRACPVAGYPPGTKDNLWKDLHTAYTT